MQSFTDFLTELQANGTARGGHIKAPQALLDLLVDQAVNQTTLLGGHPVRQDLADFVSRIMRKAKPCYPSLVVAMFYLDRLWRILGQAKKQQQSLSQSQFGQSGLPEVLAAFILADKYIYDVALANCEWAKVSGVHALPQVNGFEREFFRVLNYNIQFTEDAFREFVCFLDISLTIREHHMQATSDFPLTYSRLCQLQQEKLEQEKKVEQERLAKEHQHQHQHQQLQEATLITLRVMMVYCLSCYSSLVAMTSSLPALQAASSSSSPSSPASPAAVIKAKSVSPPKGFRHPKLIKSDSWSGTSDSLDTSAVPKPRGRKFSDTVLGQQAPWYLSLMGRIRS